MHHRILLRIKIAAVLVTERLDHAANGAIGQGCRIDVCPVRVDKLTPDVFPDLPKGFEQLFLFPRQVEAALSIQLTARVAKQVTKQERQQDWNEQGEAVQS